MTKIPKPRKSGQTGGGGHSESKFTSVRRGGRPGAARKADSGSGWPCAVVVLVGLGGLSVIGGALVAVVQS